MSSGYGLIAARDSESWNLYDFNGNKLNTERYDSIYQYYGMFGTSKVKIDNKWGLINKFGELIIPINYVKIEKFGKGIILHDFDSNLEFIDRKELINLTKVRKDITINSVKNPVRKVSHNIHIKRAKLI